MLVFACVVGNNSKTPNLSSMVVDTITQGGIQLASSILNEVNAKAAKWIRCTTCGRDRKRGGFMRTVWVSEKGTLIQGTILGHAKSLMGKWLGRKALYHIRKREWLPIKHWWSPRKRAKKAHNAVKKKLDEVFAKIAKRESFTNDN